MHLIMIALRSGLVQTPSAKYSELAERGWLVYGRQSFINETDCEYEQMK